MAWVIGKLKCALCNEASGLLHSVHGYGIYSEDIKHRIHYHPECLELIQMYPESFHSLKVDMSLEILERKKRNIKKYNSKKISEYEDKIQTLKETHFENMMPSKN